DWQVAPWRSVPSHISGLSTVLLPQPWQLAGLLVQALVTKLSQSAAQESVPHKKPWPAQVAPPRALPSHTSPGLIAPSPQPKHAESSVAQLARQARVPPSKPRDVHVAALKSVPSHCSLASAVPSPHSVQPLVSRAQAPVHVNVPPS